MIVFVRSVFHESIKYYWQGFLDECLCKLWILEYERIDISNKTGGSHDCIIWHYWHFLDISFRFQPEVCHGCHDLKQKAGSFNNVTILSLKGNN